MRVLHVCEATLGGAGRHILELVEAQAERGVEVHLLYSTRRSDKGFLKGLKAIEKGAPRLTLCELDMKRSPGPSDIPAMTAFRRYLRTNGPFEIVHSHCTKAGFLARVSAPNASRHFYTPNAFLSLSDGVPRAARWLVGLGEALLARVTARIIAVSQEEFEHGISLGISPNKLILIPNGLDIRRVHKDAAALRAEHRKQMGIDDDRVCIGFVGRLTYQKNPELLVRVVAELPTAVRKRIQVAAIGNGELKQDLESLARAAGVDQSITWLGEQDSLSWMSAFDLFIMTSRYEGLPYVLLDALVYGLPIVTTVVGGASLLLREGVNAFLAQPGDSATLARRVTELVESPTLRATMSKASIARSQMFTLDKMVQSILDEYQRVLG